MTHRLVIRALILCSFAVFAATASEAATVRGRLVHQANGVPAAGITVTIYNQYVGRSSPAYTDIYGMYYIYNVPAGTYYLELWIYPGANPIVYPITIGEPYTDIPQILVP
ncbi:MAG TPA: carboxypeptidase-like regulatory domain-containing protein [Terriglobales bacterium]|nr:carboxypeptidase-like regulatory domain-containing protein [Terriglobales bacterium]